VLKVLSLHHDPVPVDLQTQGLKTHTSQEPWELEDQMAGDLWRINGQRVLWLGSP